MQYDTDSCRNCTIREEYLALRPGVETDSRDNPVDDAVRARVVRGESQVDRLEGGQDLTRDSVREHAVVILEWFGCTERARSRCRRAPVLPCRLRAENEHADTLLFRLELPEKVHLVPLHGRNRRQGGKTTHSPLTKTCGPWRSPRNGVKGRHDTARGHLLHLQARLLHAAKERIRAEVTGARERQLRKVGKTAAVLRHDSRRPRDRPAPTGSNDAKESAKPRQRPARAREEKELVMASDLSFVSSGRRTQSDDSLWPERRARAPSLLQVMTACFTPGTARRPSGTWPPTRESSPSGQRRQARTRGEGGTPFRSE